MIERLLGFLMQNRLELSMTREFQQYIDFGLYAYTAVRFTQKIQIHMKEKYAQGWKEGGYKGRIRVREAFLSHFYCLINSSSANSLLQ